MGGSKGEVWRRDIGDSEERLGEVKGREEERRERVCRGEEVEQGSRTEKEEMVKMEVT